MKRTIPGYLNHFAYRVLPREIYIRLLFRIKCGYFGNIENPKTFREKMFWLLRYYAKTHPTIISECYDKYNVRKYVAQKVGEKYLIPLVGHFDNAEEISFDTLPDQFVIKITQSCGKNLLVFDKNKIDDVQTRNLINKWLLQSKREIKSCEIGSFHYDGKPSIIIEELLKPKNSLPLNDYKIYCIQGEVIFTRVAINPIDEYGRRKKTFIYNAYDKEWNYIEFKNGDAHSPDQSYMVKRPDCLEEMYDVASKLSEDFPFARIDLYNFDERIYFGEITFFPGGFERPMTPAEWDNILGEKMQLPIESYNK